ncbi:MAG: tetratricopeptide repeat protein [Candidatus Kariarchaeaceae archaeon]|jgi:tetratricopeptide (TPR) repeat protein
MPRFSAKAKEIHDEIWCFTDIVRAKSHMNELKDPLDIAFVKLFIASHYLLIQEQRKSLEILTEIENENKIIKDQFIQFIVNVYFCTYYMGINNPIVSKEQAEKYFDKTEQSYHEISYQDDWEKYYCIGWYYNTKAYYENVIENDISNVIKYQKKCIEAWSAIPQDGKYWSAIGQDMLGLYYLGSGDLEEAEKYLTRALDTHKKYNNLKQLWPLSHLSSLNFLKGDLQKAKELNMQRLDITKRLNRTYGIFACLTQKGFHSYHEGNYDEALKAYREGLVYRKQHGDPLQVFWGYNQIFDFYYQRFKITKDRAFLIQAEQTLTDLKELSKTHSEDKTITNYTNFAQALILKHGNIRKKGSAIDILEELIEFYPNNIEISLNLLELLFEDVIQSEDQGTINQIDELMEKLSKIPLRNNPQAIFNFISQQIFLAKYNYYIKGDPSLALDILNDAKARIITYKLDNLVNELDAEIHVLEREITRWDNLDISVKERIKQSEFSKYIQQALSIADKQM